MEQRNESLTVDDKLGFLLGTIIFVLTLPMTLLFSYLLKQMIAGAIVNEVLAVSIGFLFLALGTIANLICSVLVGLMVSYPVCWLSRSLQLPELLHSVTNGNHPLETHRLTTLGAVAGAVLAIILFFATGHGPLDIVTTKVEQLFPAPIVMNLGTASAFNLSRAYAGITGLLTIGGLFVVVGLGLGSLSAVAVERLFTRPTR